MVFPELTDRECVGRQIKRRRLISRLEDPVQRYEDDIPE